MDDARERALSYLRRHHVLNLATFGPEGLWVAAVFYASKEWELVFLSAAETRHARNLATDPRAAATIQEDYSDWRDIQGIQLEGRVRLLTGSARENAMTLYQQKYTFLTGAPAPIVEALRKVSWYSLQPQRLYFIDNSKGFGHRDEIPLSVRD